MPYDPDEIVVLMKYMKYKYADDFIKSGTIKFSSARIWSMLNARGGAGRGDRLEGIYGICYANDYITRYKFQKQYDDSYVEQHKRLLYFRRRLTMDLPCYCLYGLQANEFKQDSADKNLRTFLVSPQFFHELADVPIDDRSKIRDNGDRPSLVVIKDKVEFKKRIIAALISIGVDENDIVIEPITYVDKSKPKLYAPSPAELLWKSPSYSNQKETRIIVYTNNPDVIKLISANPLRIGSLQDIAVLFDECFSDGLSVEMHLSANHDAYNIRFIC